jgi:hypothetical protein
VGVHGRIPCDADVVVVTDLDGADFSSWPIKSAAWIASTGFMPYLTLLANRSALSARGQTPESVPKAALVTPDRQAWRKWMAPGRRSRAG